MALTSKQKRDKVFNMETMLSLNYVNVIGSVTEVAEVIRLLNGMVSVESSYYKDNGLKISKSALSTQTQQIPYDVVTEALMKHKIAEESVNTVED